MRRIAHSSFGSALLMAAAGEASAAAGSAKPATKPAAVAAGKPEIKILPISTAVVMPTNVSKRGSKSKYDYAKLEVGQSIPVVGRTAKSLNSTVSGWNREYLVVVKNADGTTQTRVNAKGETEVVTEASRHFFAADTEKGDPEGATCRIWRDK